MLFSENMSDFEKLLFAEDYIKALKKELRKEENNKIAYDNNLREIINLFKKFSPKFAKVVSYRREIMALKEKSRKALLQVEKLEAKNFKMRQKLREFKNQEV